MTSGCISHSARDFASVALIGGEAKASYALRHFRFGSGGAGPWTVRGLEDGL
jgi:hypothetical protein